MTTSPMRSPKPGYRQFWAWFVFTPPLIAIGTGILLITIANKNLDNLVTGDFSKVGLGYQSTSAARADAKYREIEADVTLPAAGGTVSVTLTGLHDNPQQIRLTLAHATLANRDQQIELVRVDGGQYQGRLPNALQDRHYLVVADLEETWRLEGQITAGNTQVHLHPYRESPL